MLGIKDSKKALAELGLNEDEISQYTTLVEPLIDFHKYLMAKLDVNSEETENVTKNYTSNYIVGKIEQYKQGSDADGKPNDITKVGEDFYFKLAGEAMRELALSYEYDTTLSSTLEVNMNKISDLFMTSENLRK